MNISPSSEELEEKWKREINLYNSESHGHPKIKRFVYKIVENGLKESIDILQRLKFRFVEYDSYILKALLEEKGRIPGLINSLEVLGGNFGEGDFLRIIELSEDRLKTVDAFIKSGMNPSTFKQQTILKMMDWSSGYGQEEWYEIKLIDCLKNAGVDFSQFSPDVIFQIFEKVCPSYITEAISLFANAGVNFSLFSHELIFIIIMKARGSKTLEAINLFKNAGVEFSKFGPEIILKLLQYSDENINEEILLSLKTAEFDFSHFNFDTKLELILNKSVRNTILFENQAPSDLLDIQKLFVVFDIIFAKNVSIPADIQKLTIDLLKLFPESISVSTINNVPSIVMRMKNESLEQVLNSKDNYFSWIKEKLGTITNDIAEMLVSMTSSNKSKKESSFVDDFSWITIDTIDSIIKYSNSNNFNKSLLVAQLQRVGFNISELTGKQAFGIITNSIYHRDQDSTIDILKIAHFDFTKINLADTLGRNPRLIEAQWQQGKDISGIDVTPFKGYFKGDYGTSVIKFFIQAKADFSLLNLDNIVEILSDSEDRLLTLNLLHQGGVKFTEFNLQKRGEYYKSSLLYTVRELFLSEIDVTKVIKDLHNIGFNFSTIAFYNIWPLLHDVKDLGKAIVALAEEGIDFSRFISPMYDNFLLEIKNLLEVIAILEKQGADFKNFNKDYISQIFKEHSSEPEVIRKLAEISPNSCLITDFEVKEVQNIINEVCKVGGEVPIFPEL
jgi:hypothetical protein